MSSVVLHQPPPKPGHAVAIVLQLPFGNQAGQLLQCQTVNPPAQPPVSVAQQRCFIAAQQAEPLQAIELAYVIGLGQQLRISMAMG
jgi:hypothetical protein